MKKSNNMMFIPKEIPQYCLHLPILISINAYQCYIMLTMLDNCSARNGESSATLHRSCEFSAFRRVPVPLDQRCLDQREQAPLVCPLLSQKGFTDTFYFFIMIGSYRDSHNYQLKTYIQSLSICRVIRSSTNWNKWIFHHTETWL